MDMVFMNNKILEVEDKIVREILMEMMQMIARIGVDANAELMFAKVKPEAIIPTKRDEDAGFDMYACIEEDAIFIHPHETMLIPTGIASCFSSDYMFWLAERGSIGTKGIAQRCGIIDSGYRNEIQAPITNLNTKPLLIVKDDVKDIVRIRNKNGNIKELHIQESMNDYYEWQDIKNNSLVYPMSKAITQGILLRIPKVKTKEIPYDELKAIPSSRGMKAWGSTQK